MSVSRFARLMLVWNVALLPGAVWAQSSATGAIAGIVTDATGAVMPGVSVEAASPALIEKVRVVVTDGAGQYKIVDLRPGTYTVTFTLAGFNVVRREGLELTTGFTATVNTELRVGALEETITVTGASPVVDVQNVRQQNLISREALDTLPQAKTSIAYGALTVGIKTTLVGGNAQDVGGSVGEQPSYLTANGGRTTDFALFIDGMRQTLGGASALRLYFESSANTQEVTLETSGMSAESVSGGVQVNFVPKEGGNTLRAFANVSYAGEGLPQSGNLTDELRARGLNSGTKQAKDYDYAGGVGGPIIKDKLWFFHSNRWWGAKVYQPGNYFNKTQGTLLYTPDLSRQAYTYSYYEDHTLRLTWQAAPKHKIGASIGVQDNCQCFFALAQNAAPEATASHVYKLVYLTQASWTYPVTNRLLIQAGMTYGRFDPQTRHLGYDGETLAKSIPIVEASTGYRYNSATSFRGAFGPTHMDQNNGRFTTSYVTGSHAAKVGLYWYWSRDENTTGGLPDPPVSYTFRGTGSVSTGFTNQAPIGVTYYAHPTVDTKRSTEIGLYAQDQWTIDRLTLNLGARFDYLHAWTPAMTRPPGYFTPAIDFAKLDNVPNWKDIGPRVGASYDLFGTGKTALKVFAGKYVEQMATTLASAASPANAIVQSATRTWNDANRDFIPQESELGPISDPNFGLPVIRTTYAGDVLLGSGVRGYSRQASASVQHELRPGVGLNFAYFRTSYYNFRVTDNVLVTNADYSPYCITAPVDPRLPGGGGNQICGLFDIKPAVFALGSQNLVTQAENYGKQTEVYNGIQFTFTARLRQSGSIGGGFSTGRTATNNCGTVRMDSPDQRFCEQTNPWRGQTQIKLSGVYPLPWRLQASAVFQNLPGIPISANYVTTNAQIAPSLGRNLGACGTRPVCTANVTVPLLEPFTRFEKRLTQLDVRLTKIARLGRTRLQGMLDVYNLFNGSDVLIQNNTFGTDWLRPTGIMSGRILKLGAQVDF